MQPAGYTRPARVPTLLKELDRLVPRYPAAMADTSRWRLAKRVFTALLADGIALDTDPVVLDAWAQRFSARDVDGRREVLGELMDQHPEYATGKVLIHDGQVAVLRAGCVRKASATAGTTVTSAGAPSSRSCCGPDTPSPTDANPDRHTPTRPPQPTNGGWRTWPPN